MVEDFYKRINSGKASYSMPLIWVKYNIKGAISKYLITSYSGDTIGFDNDAEGWSMKGLFENFTYLDGSPCGKKVE